MTDLNRRLRRAILHFWATRNVQAHKQGVTKGRRDRGAWIAVTGGAQMDGFVNLVRDLPVENGMPEASAHCKKNVVLPGCFRPGKPWDLLVVLGGRLLATIEFKSQVGPSFGHNYNNRTEEALGSATDILAAYRERAFRPTARMHVSVGGNRTVNLPRQALRTALPGS